MSRTLFSVLENTASLYGSLPALHQPVSSKGESEYRTYTWSEYLQISKEIACGLRAIGARKGDMVALDSETRAEFYLADLGVLGAGCVAAALYSSLPAADRARNILACGARFVFVEDWKTLEALRAAAPAADVVWILLTGEAEGAMTVDELRERGRRSLADDPDVFERIRADVRPEDYAVLYLTSGATGEPKMGLTTHAAIVANIDMGPYVLPLGPEDSTVVFLPSAHIAQRVVLEFLPLRCGVPVYFSEGLAKIANELRRIRPTFLLAPPRVWERVHSSIATEIRKRPKVTRSVFYTALGLGLRSARARHAGKTPPPWLRRALKAADKAVFEKIRARLGGRLRVAASGAAPLGQDLAQFYEAIGLPLIEGYGLTEGGVVSLNPLDSPRAGSIGKPLPGVEVKLAGDGELLVKGPSLFSGYYNDPAATASVLKNGWLHTGDVAEIDANGFIYITGRKKEVIVSSNGKKIYPARIESLFKMEPAINHVVVLGDRQPYVTALMTVNGNPGSDPAPEVAHAVKKVNKQLAPFEQIRRYKILDRELSIDRGELTPTMKVRRTQVIENFRDLVDELYLGREEMH